MGSSRLLLVKLTVVSLVYTCCTEGLPSVETELGTITGVTNDINVEGTLVTVKRFLGIPYAKAPVGDLRFKKPKPLEKLDSPFQATEFGPACYQVTMLPFVLTETLSEDCLVLNVFVPDKEPDSSQGHAVMFFIHGGGFAIGSGMAYNGDTLAAYGNVIVITINYRLSTFGFLTTGDSSAPGNLGFWDQHEALKWVNKYIGAFGGDKDRVTVFGESAGSISSLYQGLAPVNKGLFKRIIAQSGTPTVKLMLNPNPSKQLYTIADDFNCDKSSSHSVIECLKSVSAEEIYNKLHKLLSEHMEQMFELTPLPTIDGDFLKVHPNEFSKRAADESGEELEFLRSLDLMIGLNSAEGSGAVYFMMNGSEEFLPTREDMSNRLVDFATQTAFGDNVPDIVKKLVFAEYTDWDKPDDPKIIREEFVRLMGDVYMTHLNIDFCNLHSKVSGPGASYFYYFDLKPSFNPMGGIDWVKGADHGAELTYVFGFDKIFIKEFAKMFGLEEYPEPKAWEVEVSMQVMRYWTNFAKTGMPNLDGSLDPDWEQYDTEKKKCLHILNNPQDTTLKSNMFAREEHFWLHIIPEALRTCGKEHAQSSPFVKKSEDSCSAETGCGDE